jgi:hypothetical protein
MRGGQIGFNELAGSQGRKRGGAGRFVDQGLDTES